ncbi:MAG TPA: VOC family protein [Solirubrobacteraceae bacterium]|nr:VOC family protein [Solirubrobacteraceae bacterium]
MTIRVADRDASERFYDTVLRPLAIDQTYRTNAFSQWHEFMITAPDADNPPTQRLHVAFGAPSREHVDEFWRVGTEAGYRDDGPPGLRPQYSEDYYGAFLLDKDGNSVEAINDSRPNPTGVIDHLWIRVADVARARAFYETIAPHAGLILGHDAPDRVQYRGPRGGSFSLVAGTPTEHVHMAFGTDDDGAVQRFHKVATEAGYKSRGAPGERPRYHPGYYAAYVFDPDGNNIEVVNHHRS